MTNDEKSMIKMLREASNEIIILRRTNAILDAKVSTMELMERLFLATPPPYLMQSRSDVVADLETEISMIENKYKHG